MIGSWSVEQVRSAEQELMATLPAGTLMQRAAFGLATACAQLLGGTYGARVLVVAGSGNNGGDALFAGALLGRRGARVEALLLSEHPHADALAALRGAGGRVVDRSAVQRVLEHADLVLDGAVGIGGQPGLRPGVLEVFDAAARALVPIVAVDLPSGIDVQTGECPAPSVHADVTVTFGAHKTGLLVDPAASRAGDVRLVDIGLRPYLPAPAVEVLERDDVIARLPTPDATSDKYSRGVVGVVAGSADYTGAAVLCVGSAMHGGAGMVRYLGPSEPTEQVRQHWPAAVVGKGRVQSWVLGPGLNPDGQQGEALREALREALYGEQPVVVDAEALRYLPERFDKPALLTPHAGELARMLQVERPDVEARMLHHARAAAERWQATVLLKGSTTVVATPQGRVRVNPTGVPQLATAGSGDVLSGLCGALLAGGLDPLDAGSVAAYVHGLCGARAAQRAGLPTAQEVLQAVPGVLAALLGHDRES